MCPVRTPRSRRSPAVASRRGSARSGMWLFSSPAASSVMRFVLAGNTGSRRHLLQWTRLPRPRRRDSPVCEAVLV
jgi:hypothetical protein